MKLRYIFAALLCLCLLIAPAAAAGGSGTPASPYIIETTAELQSIQNNLGAHYRLANDIDLSSVIWTPIGSESAGFYGSFDGNGKTIKNLDLSTSTQNSGFFGMVTSGAVIKDVTFQDCSVTSTSKYSGVIIGLIAMSSSVHETAVISDVDLVRCSVSSSSSYAGCLAGYISTYAVVEITDCDVSYSEAESNSNSYAGCFVGVISSSSTEITRCNVLYSHARAGNQIVGCFVGAAEKSSLVIDSSGARNSIAEAVGGDAVGCFVGFINGDSSVSVLNSDVVNCIMKGIRYVGGLYGYIFVGSSAASDCSVTGCTIVATSYAGGVAGKIESGQRGIFSGCTVTDSTIIASNYAAGICPAYS